MSHSHSSTMKATKNSSIKGLGNDIVEIVRIKNMIKRFNTHVLDRLFTKTEQQYCYSFKDPYPHFSGRFAAKEAIVKALGVGFGKKIHWLDIEIVKDQNNKPIVSFSEKVQKDFSDPQVMISISHAKENATAVAIWTC